MKVARCAIAALTVILATSGLVGCAFDESVGADPASVDDTSSPQSRSAPSPLRPQSGAVADNENPQFGAIGDHQSVVDAACGENPSGTDLGSRYGASGTVERTDADGLATVYRVAPGDSYKAIVERFCLSSVEFATINSITNMGQIYMGDVYAFTEEAAPDARRAAGADFPACPRNEWGSPVVASIGWESLSDDRAKATDIGTPIDTGAAGTAQGIARTDDAGILVQYVVAAGDTWRGIRDRFCMDVYYVASLTGLWAELPMIHPGDVIPLQPQHLEIDTL